MPPQVVANADASDLREDYQQTKEGSVLSVNGQSITVRVFATASDCCDALLDGGWVIHIATSEPGQGAPDQLQSKLAVIVATPFPSKAFVDAAQNTQTGQNSTLHTTR